MKKHFLKILIGSYFVLMFVFIGKIVVSASGFEFAEVNDGVIVSCATDPPQNVIIPEEINGQTITGIGSTAFSGRNITSIDLPSTLTNIEESAFENCTQLESVIAPGVTNIGDKAFYGCNNLSSVNLPNVTNIGSEAFRYTGLTEAKFENVTSIGSSAFQNCANLQIVDMPNLSVIEVAAFGNCPSLSSINFPLADEIKYSAFMNDNSLQNVKFPKLTIIGDSAFGSCQNLQSIECPNVNTIGEETFRLCKNLKSIEVPNATSIGDSAFVSCSELSSIKMPNVISIGISPFSLCNENLVVYGNSSIKETIEHYGYEFKSYVNNISLNKSSVSMKIGETETLTATVNPTDAFNKNITWSSSKPSVVTVDNTGKLVAVAEGSATITVTSEDGSGIIATCIVTVKNETPNPGPNPDPDPNPNPGPNPDPEKPDGNENSSIKMNNMLTSLIKNAAGKNEKTAIYFKDYSGNDAISIDVFNLLAENPNAVLVLDYTFFDEDTQKDIHVHAVINQAILSKIVTSDIKLFGPACLSGFVQYYNDLPAEIKNQNY